MKPDPTIEWNGMRKDPDGIYYFLECKHSMTPVPTGLSLANHTVDVCQPSMGSC
jgi:hypothetical protein